MTRQARCASLALLALALLSASARAEDAAQIFQSLFGAEIRKAQTSPGTDDEVRLAGELLAVAAKDDQRADLVEVICRKVAELAQRSPKGLGTAIEAWETLKKRVPAKSAECDEKILALLRRQYATARGAEKAAAGERLLAAVLACAEARAAEKDFPEAARLGRQALAIAGALRSNSVRGIQGKIRHWTALAGVTRQVALLEAKLQADPADAVTRNRLVEMKLVELDDPGAATRSVAEDTDQVLRTYVPLAAKEITELAPQVTGELGFWYYGLVGKASTLAREGMLRRTEAYLEVFVAKQEDQADSTLLKAKLTLEKVREELKKYDEPVVAGAWLDVLRLVDPARHGIAGRWVKSDGKVGMQRADRLSRIGIPVAPKGDYELKVQLVRQEGSNDVCIYLPVGGRSVMLKLSSGNGQATGLSNVDGKDCTDNETKTDGKLANGAVHTVHATVKSKDGQATLLVALDGEKRVDWTGPLSRLSVSDFWRMPNNDALGLGLDGGNTGYFQTVQLRMLTGKPTPATWRNPQEKRPDWRNRNNNNSNNRRSPNIPGGRSGGGRSGGGRSGGGRSGGGGSRR